MLGRGILAALSLLLLIFGWGHLWAFSASIPILLLILFDVIRPTKKREYPASYVRLELIESLNSELRQQVVPMLDERAKIVAEPASHSRIALVEKIDDDVAMILPARLYSSRSAAPTVNSSFPLHDRLTLLAFVLAAVSLISGMATCAKGFLDEGAALLVKEQYDRCDVLKRTGGMSDTDFAECIRSAMTYEKEHGPSKQ